MRAKTQVVAERNVGIRTLAGTNWPIVDQVKRQVTNGRVEWVATYGLCNGTALKPDALILKAALRQLAEVES